MIRSNEVDVLLRDASRPVTLLFERLKAGGSGATSTVVPSSVVPLHDSGHVVVDTVGASPRRMSAMSGMGAQARCDGDVIEASSIAISVSPAAPVLAGAGVGGNEVRNGALEMDSHVLGLPEQSDRKRDCTQPVIPSRLMQRLMTHSDKLDHFSLNQVRAGGDGASRATFKKESKDEGNSRVDSLVAAGGDGASRATFMKKESKDEGDSRVDSLMAAQGSTLGSVESGWRGDGSMGGTSSVQAEKEMNAARMQADGDNPTVPKAGVGMVLKEMQLPGGDTVLAVKSLAPGAPAVLSGMINPGDILLTVDGGRVTAGRDGVENAAKSILGEVGSIISLQMERDGKRFAVALRRSRVPINLDSLM